MGKLTNYIFGGVASPVAGDGYGGAPPPKGPPKPLRSPALGSNDYFHLDRSIDSILTTSHDAPSIHTDLASERASGTPQQPYSQRISPRPTLLTNGVRAPRCSLAPPPAVTATAHSTRPSIESFRTASEETFINTTLEMPQGYREGPWEDYEIPQELELVSDDTPQDVRNVIQESMDEHRAMRASRMQSQAASIRTTPQTVNALSESDGPFVAESCAMASARSTPISDYLTSSLSIPSGSDTSVELDAESGNHLQLPTNVLERPTVTSSQESLRNKAKPSRVIIEIERRFHESKARAHKSHNLFRLLPHRRLKGQPSPVLHEAEPAMSECTGCLDDIFSNRAIGLPCRHNYCSSCFSQLVSTSIQNEASYPPKCCLTEIPKKTIRENLPTLICALFEEKALEYAVPTASRYYCVSSTCGKWIDTRHAKRTNGAIQCPSCTTKLCTLCRGPQHPSNEDCPQDFGLDMTLEQAERAGWRRCYNCRAMVELNTGCRHITCKCRAEFCYTCGSVWRTCHCTEADQVRREQDIRTRLARFEVDQRAEETEMGAAMEAVEAAERLIREEREAEERQVEEEARELQRQEAARLQKIADYYDYLRGVLERVHLQQKSAIEKRHNREWEVVDKMRDDLDSVAKAAERVAQVKSERDKIIASIETTIKALQRQYATAMMGMIERHVMDQVDVLASSVGGESQDAETLQAEKMEKVEALMVAQDLERAAMKSDQARDIQKWKQRGEASLQAFDSQTLALKMRLEEAENINKQEGELRNNIISDGKWFDLLFEERFVMLAEDERKLVRNGGEIAEKARYYCHARLLPSISHNKPAAETDAPFAPQPQSRREAIPAQCLVWDAQERDVDSAVWNLAPLTAEERKLLDAMMTGKFDERIRRNHIVRA